MKRITVAYIRVSTEKQTDGTGLEQQRAAITAWSAATGVQIDEVIAEAKSGMTDEREEVAKLLDRARNGEIERLVIDRMDRLGRLLVVSETLYTQFVEAGVQVECVAQKLGNSPMEVAMRQMAGVFAQMQRAEWLGRMKQCRAAAARKGRYHGGLHAPLGYCAVGGGKLAVDPRTAPVVRRVFELRANGCSHREIVAQLSAEGFHTSRGTQYGPGQISKILAREAAYKAQAPAAGKQQLEAGAQPVQPALLETTSMHVTRPNH